MAEPRPNFLSAFRSKLAAWLRVVAARLEGRDRTPDLMSPPRPPGPPAHWVERVQHAAPELLQPGPPNFRTRSPGDNPRHLPAAKLAPPPPRASQAAGPVRTALRNLWLAVSRRTETPQHPVHEDKASGTKAEAVANYPTTSSAPAAAAPRFPVVPARKSQPAPAAFPQTQRAAPAPPRDEVREDQTVRARDRGKRIPPIRLSPGPNLIQPARSEPPRDLPADLGNPAQGRAKAAATLRLAPVPEKTCNVPPDEPPEKVEPRRRKSGASDRSDMCNFPDFPVADRPAGESQPLPPYPPWSSTRMTRPLTRPAYPPATTPIPAVPRVAERESPERWPALPPAAEAETRDDWRAWQREEQHRARLDLEHQGLLWTA